MAVNPGFGGQAFIPTTVDKVRRAAEMLRAAGSVALLEVDGGVGPATAGELVAAGCSVLAAGSSLFGGGDVRRAVQALRLAAGG
jgi:ribulose-phosphate 3-epimerase